MSCTRRTEGRAAAHTGCYTKAAAAAYYRRIYTKAAAATYCGTAATRTPSPAAARRLKLKPDTRQTPATKMAGVIPDVFSGILAVKRDALHLHPGPYIDQFLKALELFL